MQGEREVIAVVTFKVYWPAVGHALEWHAVVPERLVNGILAHLATIPCEAVVGAAEAHVTDRYPN